MHNPKLGRTHRWPLAATAAALAGATLFAGPASAGSVTNLCLTAGRPATSAEILSRSQAQLVAIQAELPWLQADFDGARTASPAGWRLADELESLEAEARDLDNLRMDAFIRSDATPGSAAQFRAQEELDMVCASPESTGP